MKIIKQVLIGFFVLLATILFYLIVVVFFPVLSLPKQPLPERKKDSKEDQAPPPSRQTIHFSAAGTNISAWLYLPQETRRPVPCIIMNQGFGGTKDCVLERYALRFIEQGLAVLTYDYRHFGESDGEPRQLYEVTYQLEDLKTAIAYARGREEIDPEKIVIWGTSASGGYGLVIAAEDKRIAAVIAQCAAIDHEADDKLFLEREGYGYFIKLLLHAQRDKGRSRLNLSPHKLPIVGRPGTVALLTAPGAFEGYASLVAESETFKNEVCARLFFMRHGRDPNVAAQEVECPVLFLVCEHDNLASPESYVKAAEALGDKAVVKSYPIGHFDIYQGAYFEEAMKEMIALIKEVC